MKRNRIAILTLSALLATTFALSAQAGNRKHKRHDGQKGDRIGALLKQLDLTTEQKDKIKVLREEHKATKTKNREAIRKLHERMRKAWESENPNRKKIMGIHKKIHKLKGEMGESKIKLRLDVYNVLTPEQRKEARTLLIERHKRMDDEGHGKRRGHGEGRGHGPGPGHGPDCDCPRR